jgi:dTDP-4-amino-4,6-dideoxygalactose transaminase
MVPFVDLKSQYNLIKGEINDAISNVLESTQFVLGDAVSAFERSFAEYCHVEHAVALNTGTSALHLALLGAGVGPGDEVITVSMTFVATTAAVLYCGATPVFVDVDPLNWTMDPTLVEAAITDKTKAILPVHLHGRMADMQGICAVAERYGIAVIEDAAQAHGATDRGRTAGSVGLVGCFSFYPGKNLGAYGEGGALVTNDPEIAWNARVLRDWGQAEKYNHVRRGFNYRMDGVQGAILNVKMKYIEYWTELRRTRAARYSARLAELGSPVARPADEGESRHAWHVYAVRTQERDRLAQRLKDQGIGTGIHYPIPVHLQPAYSNAGFCVGSMAVTEQLASEFLSLPLYPELTDEQVDEVVDAVNTFQV